MMITELLRNASYIDVALLVLIILSFIFAIAAPGKTKKKAEETEEKIEALKKYQEDSFEMLNKKHESLKEVLVDRINKLTARLNAILKSNETVMLEIDNKTKPLQDSIDDTMDQVKATRDTLRKTMLENEKEMKKMGKEINDFSKEIQKMKDDIRERTIDLEL
jgi:peptidoglycan hydrolase CwlO-like protein